MATPRTGDTVTVHFTGRLDDGRVFASSREREPVTLTVGDHEVIPALEETLLQMTPGEERTITVPADRAYGPRKPELVVPIDRSDFPSEIQAEVGQIVQVRQDDGEPLIMTIAEVHKDRIVIDGNHPLAGQELTFDLLLVEIRDASPAAGRGGS